MAHLLSFKLTHSLLFLPGTGTFLENLSKPLRCAYIVRGWGKTVYAELLISIEKLGKHVYRDTATRSTEKNRKAFRAAER